MCTPCHFNYDMIGKLETGFDDLTVSKYNLHLFNFKYVNLNKFSNFIFSVSLEKDSVR